MDNNRKNLWIVIVFVICLAINCYLVYTLLDMKMMASKHPAEYPVDVFVKDNSPVGVEYVVLHNTEINKEIPVKYNEKNKRWNFEINNNENPKQWNIKYKFVDEAEEKTFSFSTEDLTNSRYPQRRVIDIQPNRECTVMK